MRIQSISVEHLPPLEDIDILDCDKQVNLFIGPNASGKSTILRAIEALSSTWGSDGWFDNSNRYPIYAKGFKHAQVHVGVNYGRPTDIAYYPDGADRAGSGTNIWEAVPFLYIPATRVGLRPQNIFDQTIYRPEPYGFSLTWDDILSRHFSNSWGAFNGEHIEDFVHAFREKLRSNPNQQNQLRKALVVGQTCAKSICPEVIRDDMPQAYVEFIDEADLDEDDPEFYPTGRVVHYAMGIGTTDDILGEPLYAGALSSGTQGTLLWIWALALKIAHHYDWAEDWEKKPAILLIDEIENHLHPTWQRRVIPALLEHFPGLQIFATTHSPFVVAGLKAGQVHLLKRDDNGVITASTNSEDIIGWTADEILRTWMGVDEPTDLTTIERANRLRELREKKTLTIEEESELQALRRQINEDLLAKGNPLEEQRKHYADLMQRFLLSRQSDLSQDGE